MNPYVIKAFLIVLLVSLSVASMLDVFVSKEILNYENCPSVLGPSINITHGKNSEDFTICWRFLTTAYPHCPGRTCHPIRSWSSNVGFIDFRLYQPISGMSEDGRHASWMGFGPEDEGRRYRNPWRSILFNEHLMPYEWQSICWSYSKKTKTLLMYHNGVRYMNYKVVEDHIDINKNLLTNFWIFEGCRGFFTDLQVCSKPIQEDNIQKWTTCQFSEPGDVFAWDIEKLNMTNDERMITDLDQIERKALCKSKEEGQTDIYCFGQGYNGENIISNIEGNLLCRRLNGKISMLPKDEKGFEKYKKWAKFWLKKSNVFGTNVWIGGQSVLGDKYGASHWYPEPSGIYDMEDPETGEILTNEINKAYINPEDHTYQKLVQICMMLDTYY